MFHKKQLITVAALITVGIVGRLALEAYPNIETLTAVSIIAGALLGPYLGLAVALFSVVGSDMVIGNTNILLYTWTAWVVIGISSALLKRHSRSRVMVWLDSLKFTGFGVLTTLFFFLWTNFGVWHLSGMYLPTWDGLMLSYFNGLPFLRNQLLGNLLIVPVLSVCTLGVYKYFSLEALNNVTINAYVTRFRKS
ncbi:MAG: hypothetical protein ACD_41C00323G0002 [uncultured bacterium]|nr:MAG: hypothetical protein ACD_41C00323G0002 [uncultured bacterium]